MNEITLLEIEKNMLLLNIATNRMSIVMDYTTSSVEMYNLPAKRNQKNSGGDHDEEKSHGVACRQWYTLKDLNAQFKRVEPSQYPHENFEEIFEGWKQTQEYARQYLKNNKLTA
jgi:hypothetical protein